MIKILISLLVILLSHICQSLPTITDYYDINEVNKISLLELQRSRFEISLQSNLQVTEYGLFDFSQPLNGRSVRVSGVLVPRDIEVYLRILSSPVLHNPPYNFSFRNDERLLRHLGFVKGVVKLPKSGAAYKMIERILKNQVSSLTHIKDFYKPKQAWPTYLDNRAAYTNLWKHATNLFTVKLLTFHGGYYYSVNGDVYVYKYHIFIDQDKFHDLAILLGYWNFDQVDIPQYLLEEFELEINKVNRSNYPIEFFSKIDEFHQELNDNTLYAKFYKNLSPGKQKSSSNFNSRSNPNKREREHTDYNVTFNTKTPNVSKYDSLFQLEDLNLGLEHEEDLEYNYEYHNPNYYTEVEFVDWVGGLTWEEAMQQESKKVAKVLIKILYKTTRKMMKLHNIDVGMIQKDRTQLYKTTLYSKSVKKLRNMVNNFRLLTNRFDDVVLDEEAEEILFESGSKYKLYWNLKNDSLYNRRTVADRSAQDVDQNVLDLLLFEPNKFYNKLINISGDAINFKQVYDILIVLTQDTTEYNAKTLFFSQEPRSNDGGSLRSKFVLRRRNTSKNVSGLVSQVLEQYKSLPTTTNNLLRGRAKCLMAFLYLFGVSDTKGVVNFPHGWPRHIKKSMTLLISGMSSPCGLCNTLLGFLASIGFPPVSNNIYAWETRRNDDETTVFQLISGNFYNSFLKQNVGLNQEQNKESHEKTSEGKEKEFENKVINNKQKKEKANGNQTKKIPEGQDVNMITSSEVVDRTGYDLPLLCYLSGSYKNDELSSLAYSYYIHSGIGNPTRTCQKSAQSSINRSPKNVGMMCLDAIPYAIESAKSSMKNKHDQVHDASDEYKSKRYAEFIKKLSNMGDSDGLRMMGDFYYTGHEEGGIRRNYQQAINFWSRAAESGDPSSALAIAHHHLSNLQSDESGHAAIQAERYLRMVLNSSSPATSNFSTANFYLYRHGLGQPRDAAVAARYLRESADRGDVNSMVLMGHAYAGILTDVTPPEGRNIFMSFYYYRRAAQSGNIVGLFNSAVFTLHGYDLEYTNSLDRCNEAYKLFSRVARMGTMSTVLKVLSKRAKHNKDKIGHVLTNMMLSELGDSNAHRELTKHFKTNSVFCYTENLDPDITSPTTLYTSKNTSNSNNPITFKKFEIYQNFGKKQVTIDPFETTRENPQTNNSVLGNMGTNTNVPSNLGNTTSRVNYPDRNEIHRLSREIRMLNMVRVTEMPEDPEPDLRTRGMWSRDELHNVSIFESLIKSSSMYKEASELEKEVEKEKKKENETNKEDKKEREEMKHNEEEEEEEEERENPGSCYYYYSRRGAYSPQNSTPLLLAEALLSGKPWLPSEALFWAKRSKEADSLKGSYMYATMLEAGLGAPKNCQLSFRIFKEFLTSKSRGERILGLICILRNRLISKMRHPHFLYTFLVRFLYDSYTHSRLSSESYTPCDFAFFEIDRIPPVGVRLLSIIYLAITLFTVYVYIKITR